MAISLSVPEARASLPKEIETQPKKAKAWIESLPLTRLVESGRSVAEHLSLLNRASMPAEDRCALVEIYSPTIEVLLDELQAIYAYSSLPMPNKQLEAFELARVLLNECAISYKRLILEKTGKFIVFNARKNLPIPIYRAMSYLRANMLLSYKTYYPVSTGIWAEANSLFQYADENNLLNEIVDTDSKITLGDVYAEMLVLSLADPYRLMHGEVDHVLDLLAKARGLVRIEKWQEGLTVQAQFIALLDADQGPRAVIPGNALPPTESFRIVDTAKLVEKLQQGLKANPVASKGRAVHDINDLVTRLIALLGDPPKRQFRRNPAESGVALCSGIKAIAHFTELAANENPEDDVEAIREGRTVPLLKIPRDDVSQAMGVEEWLVLNQSANGIRLQRENGRVAVTVGEIVGVRFLGGRSWNIGIVRWLTLSPTNALEIGVELIAPGAEAITIQPTFGSNNKIAPALLVESLAAEGERDSVLTHTDTFSDLREFELVSGQRAAHVRATTLIERTTRFDLFQFQAS